MKDGRLDVLAEVTRRADGDEVSVDFLANGERFSFTERVEDGRVRFKRVLPPAQRRKGAGIIEMRYAGNERVRPTEVRVRAANRKARLTRDLLSLEEGLLTARGPVSDRAEGVVRLILGFNRPDGSSGTWEGRATIGREGSWRVEEQLLAERVRVATSASSSPGTIRGASAASRSPSRSSTARPSGERTRAVEPS